MLSDKCAILVGEVATEEGVKTNAKRKVFARF